MDLKHFYATIEQKTAAIRQDHREQLSRFRATQNPEELRGQPAEEGSVYIASRPNELLEIRGGSVCQARYRLASQRIIEGTHELASAAQIAAFFKTQENNLAVTRGLDLKTRERQLITVQPAAVGPLQPATK
jgi:hypothetical protein